MVKDILFYLVVFLANIIQGITGFAGTILAMTPSIYLVGYDVAKPVLNVLGVFAGLLIMLKNIKEVEWKELKIIIPLMFLGILAGTLIKPLFAANMKPLYVGFGIFVLLLAAKGLFLGEDKKILKESFVKDVTLLLLAGLVHGLFVSGGPLLVEYIGGKLKDQQKFRVTLSAIWVVLNTIIFVDDVRYGYWTVATATKLVIVLPIFLLAIYIGGRLSKVMSRKVFLFLTYILMAFSGVMLLIK